MDRTAPSPTTSHGPSAALGIVCVIALNLRWFVPAEDGANGATLWLAAFWCSFALVATWFPFARDAIARRWTRADSAAALLVGGHVLSGVLVLIQGDGNRHVASTLLVEWLGIGAVWSILRDIVRVPGYRAAIWQSTMMALVAIAILGCWQHWIELPSMAHRLGPKFDAVRSARASGGTSPAEQELSREGVPLHEPEFTLFEKRLRDSREPFGFFALANTLGGFLAAGLMLWLGNRLCPTGSASIFSDEKNDANTKPKTLAKPVAHQNHVQNESFWPTVLGTIVLVLCLLLTKSRTALLSVILIGGIVVVLRTVGTRLRLSLSRGHLSIAAGSLIAIVVLIAVLSRSGSWDWEVITEAAKSLSYRVYYWSGTATLIAERPILGGGLGQFRNAYLRVKDPAASEEIADPHNLVLDVWYNGGLLAVAGAFWLAATLIITTWKSSRPDATQTDTSRAALRLLFAGAAAPWAAFIVQYHGAGYWDDRLLVIGLVLMATAFILDSGYLTLPVPSRSACGLAALVLFTHLLGAGGIGYTTVVQFLLLCLAGTFSPVSIAEETVPSRQGFVWLRRGILLMAFLSVALLWRPDIRGMVDTADRLVSKGAPAATIRTAYTQAMKADPWNPIPCARLGEFEFRQWETAATARPVGTEIRPDNLVDAGRALNSAKRRDPANGQWWHRHGTMLWSWAKLAPDKEIAKEAATLFSEAVARYPTNSTWQAELSDAAAAADDTPLAEKAARAALAQDALNQRFGHVERILAADVRARLEGRVIEKHPN